MRFLLYNLRYCTGAGAGFHLPFPGSGYLRRTTRNLRRITSFIRDRAPDVVGLLEVDGGSFRSRRTNQAQYIAEALGHYHCFESKYGEHALVRSLPVMNKQVDAILSGPAIEHQSFHYFNHGVKRLVIELELHDVTIFLVHLSLKYRHRHYQLRDFSAMIKEVRKPRIVAGDFNVAGGERELELFLGATGLKNANVHDIPSYPSWGPHRELDYVLHSPGITVRNFSIPRVNYSDHLPLICDFDVEH